MDGGIQSVNVGFCLPELGVQSVERTRFGRKSVFWRPTWVLMRSP
jgi:hypothetical protein